MKKSFYLDVLSKAADAGLLNTVNITEDYKKALIADKIDQGKPVNWQDIPKDMFRELVDSDYLHIISGFDSEKDAPCPDDWINRTIVHAIIKPKGLLFVYEREKIRFSKRSIWATIIGLVLTVFFSAFSLLYSNRNYNIAKSNAMVSAQINPLKKQLEQQDMLLKQELLRVDSLSEIIDLLLAKPSPKKR